MDPPPAFERRNMAPPFTGTPPLERRIMLSPKEFFSKPHKNCPPFPGFLGGASSAVRAQCNYLGVWPY